MWADTHSLDRGIGEGQTQGGTHEVGGLHSASRNWSMTFVVALFSPLPLWPSWCNINDRNEDDSNANDDNDVNQKVAMRMPATTPPLLTCTPQEHVPPQPTPPAHARAVNTWAREFQPCWVRDIEVKWGRRTRWDEEGKEVETRRRGRMKWGGEGGSKVAAKQGGRRRQKKRIWRGRGGAKRRRQRPRRNNNATTPATMPWPCQCSAAATERWIKTQWR